MQNQPGFQQSSNIKPAGTVTIDSDAVKTSKRSDNNDGEYVDYEEVK